MKKAILLPTLCLMLFSCSQKSGKEEALTALNTVERVKDEWAKVEKPLEIIVTERTKEELAAIGSIGVFLSDNQEETAREFHFDGESFKPVTPVLADSTVRPVIFYPFQTGLHPSDTVEVRTPMGAVLSGSYVSTTQTNEKIHVKMKLKDLAALLRLKIQSDNISDILNGVEVINPRGVVVTHRKPFNGEWLETRAAQSVRSVLTECMLNNGRHHDFHLVPNESPGDVTVGLQVNGKYLYVKTTLPPLRAGSITELHLSLAKAKLSIGSSWVDTRHPFCDLPETQTDSVKSLQFLQKDGTISETYNDQSIAIVMETDGVHGKAVALKDSERGMVFRESDFSTGLILPTVDGQFCEGCFNPNRMENGHENTIAFNPSVKYSEKCALGHRNGCRLTGSILMDCDLDVLDIFVDMAVLRTAYIPSVFEMAQLSLFLSKYENRLPDVFEMPEGFYTTSCESSEHTYYAVNPVTCRISAYNSKAYPTSKLRLYYLF
ncbi:MAG: hypothetical protein NC206_04475 [Bacteroides sp.]|nr:hypothetical protein [Roseburia sp.]MCM1346319.1 hypothetical protein [Bacteroides sp.]MCM1420792.1 hypothetical protein [Bacteroides sp.]